MIQEIVTDCSSYESQYWVEGLPGPSWRVIWGLASRLVIGTPAGQCKAISPNYSKSPCNCGYSMAYQVYRYMYLLVALADQVLRILIVVLINGALTFIHMICKMCVSILIIVSA